MKDEGVASGSGETADSRSLEPRAVSPDSGDSDSFLTLAEHQEQETLAAYHRSRSGVRADIGSAAAAARGRLADGRQAEARARREEGFARLRSGLHQLGKSNYTDEEADLLIEEGLRRAQRTDKGITP